jgi:hypothetical protein
MCFVCFTQDGTYLYEEWNEFTQFCACNYMSKFIQLYSHIHKCGWKIIDLHTRCVYNFWNTFNNYPIDILKTIYTHDIGENLKTLWVVELNIINPNSKIKLGCPKG